MTEKSPARIFRNLKLKDNSSISDFKKCLGHISIYESGKNNANSGNSRHVFLGMYAFKGVLAELVSKYIAGNGKQLQQYLGNAFSKEKLEALFDTLGLEQHVQLHPSLAFENYKHIFAYAYLGFVYQHCTTEYIEEIANEYFIQNSEQFLPKTHSLNTIEILKAKTEQILKSKIKLVHSSAKSNDSLLFTTQVLLVSGELIGQHSSVSKTYAKTKAIKLALRYVLDKEAELPSFQKLQEKRLLKEREKLSREKALKQKTHESSIADKKEKRAVIREQKRIEAKEREYRRALNKINAKDKGIRLTEKEKVLEQLKDPDLNPSKRRFLEDKLK